MITEIVAKFSPFYKFPPIGLDFQFARANQAFEIFSICLDELSVLLFHFAIFNEITGFVRIFRQLTLRCIQYQPIIIARLLLSIR